jgi:hypothetical protein
MMNQDFRAPQAGGAGRARGRDRHSEGNDGDPEAHDALLRWPGPGATTPGDSQFVIVPVTGSGALQAAEGWTRIKQCGWSRRGGLPHDDCLHTGTFGRSSRPGQ